MTEEEKTEEEPSNKLTQKMAARGKNIIANVSTRKDKLKEIGKDVSDAQLKRNEENDAAIREIVREELDKAFKNFENREKTRRKRKK